MFLTSAIVLYLEQEESASFVSRFLWDTLLLDSF